MSEGILPRSAQIRCGDYVVVEGSRGSRRDFRITVGLREGWDEDGRVYDISEAVRTARAWMRRRVEGGMPALSGMFTRAEVTYAWPRPDGSAGSGRASCSLHRRGGACLFRISTRSGAVPISASLVRNKCLKQ
jgi:hypothetical protein